MVDEKRDSQTDSKEEKTQKKTSDTRFQLRYEEGLSKGEQNNDSKTITEGKEKQKVYEQTIQEQGKDRKIYERDTGLNGREEVSRSNVQGNVIYSKVRNNNSVKNKETSTKFQEAGQGFRGVKDNGD